MKLNVSLPWIRLRGISPDTAGIHEKPPSGGPARGLIEHKRRYKHWLRSQQRGDGLSALPRLTLY